MNFDKLDLENINIDEDFVNHLRFKKLGEDYFITNDFGYFKFLKKKEFKGFLNGDLNQDDALFQDLYEKGFIKRDLSKVDELTHRFACKNSSILGGPGLHIIVTTLRCNYNCVYCQASSENMDAKGFDMDKETARKVVDRIFETTSNNITIEFQGGEPMVNWEVIKFIVDYGRKKEEESDKKVNFSLVTNFSLMTQERFDFLLEKGVIPCTSLDGPKELHNKNRPYADGDSYKKAIEWIKKYKKVRNEAKEDRPRINALVTISRESLKYPKEIVDEYLNLDLFGIHLRPLSYLGYSAGEAKNQIGYTADEFIDFWKKAIDYIIEINKEGKTFFERSVRLRLYKILTSRDPGYTDLSSPCGAVLGQVLYNYNGDLYTCDEGRMIEDDSFKIGHVDNVSYEEMVNGETTKMMLSASTLENQSCDLCPYKPYCGVCPVKNYAHHGSLFPNMKETDWCKLNTKMFDYIFEKLKDEEVREIFESWVN